MSAAKTIILGAGPSGLGVAWGLVESGIKDILILEKASRVGGLSGSIDVGGVTFDYGPHRFSPEFPDLVRRFQTLLEADFLEVQNNHAVVFDGRTYRYPPVISDFLNLSTVSHGTQVVGSYIGHKLRSRLSRRKGEETFESNIVDTFGPEFYSKIVSPLCHKVWGDPSRLDPSFAKLRFSVPTFVQWAKKLANHPDTFNDKTFFYPKHGFQQMWDVLAEHLKSQGVEFRFNCGASEIEVRNGRAQSLTITGESGSEKIPVNWIVGTIPAQHFARILKPSPFSSQELLAHQFQNRGILLIALKIRKARTLPARVVIFPEPVYPFNRLYEQNQFSEWTTPPGYSGVMADIITDVGSPLWESSDSSISERVISSMCKLGYFERSQLEVSRVIRHAVAYPAPTLARENAQREFNERISEIENCVCTGRFASSDYNNSHTAIQKGFTVAGLVAGRQSYEEWLNHAEGLRKTAIRD